MLFIKHCGGIRLGSKFVPSDMKRYGIMLQTVPGTAA